MNHKNEIIELLIVENEETIIDFFKVLTGRFNMQVKYVKNTTEFVELVKKSDFQNIICDIDLGYKFEGFFISTLYNNLKRIRGIDGKMYLLSDRAFPTIQEGKCKFDGIMPKNFQEIYDFLAQNYDFKSYYEQADPIEFPGSAVSL